MYQREALLTDDQRGLLLDDQPLFHFEPPAPVPARTHVPSVLETSPSDFPKVDELVEVLKGIGAYDERHHDKYAVLRFLKARNYEVEKARDMWVAMLRWRRENKVDTINSWFSFFEKREFLQLYPQGFHKTDWLGRPVSVQRIGQADLNRLLGLTTEDRMRLFHISEQERLQRVIFPACSAAAGRHVDQVFSIIDMAGVRLRDTLRVKKLLSMFLKLDSDNYPETLGVMAIVNAPDWFARAFGFIKDYMDARTQKKIHILGPNDYGPFLAKHVPPHHLLPEYGGTSQERLEDDVGPWPPAPVHLDPPAAAAAPPHLQDWPASASAAGNGRRGNSGGTELDTFSSSVGSGGPAVAAAAAAASSATNSNGFARLQAHQHHHHPNGALLPPVHSLPQLPTSSSASIGRPGATAAPFAASLISFDDEVTARKGPLAGVAEERSSAGTATSGGGGGGGFSHQRTLSLGSIADNASVSNEDDGASSTSTGQGGNPPLDRLSFYTATSGDHNHSQSQISADLVGLQLSGGGGGSSPGPGDFGEVSMDGAAAVCCMPGLKLRQRRRNQPGWVELGESIREEDPNEFGSSSGLGGGALGQDVESGAQRLLGRRSSGGHGSGPAAGAKGGRRGSDGGGGNGGASGQQQRHVRRVNKVPSAQQLLAVGDAEPVDPEDDFFDDARRMYSRSRRRSKLAETFCCAVM